MFIRHDLQIAGDTVTSQKKIPEITRATRKLGNRIFIKVYSDVLQCTSMNFSVLQCTSVDYKCISVDYKCTSVDSDVHRSITVDDGRKQLLSTASDGKPEKL